MLYQDISGVPDFECEEFNSRQRDYVVLIPIINEGNRILNELKRAQAANVSAVADIVICDGGSTDGSTEKGVLVSLDINTLDSIEDVPHFIEKLEEGFDLVQGSRFVKGGVAINTPLSRLVAVRLLHAPVISMTARQWFTDTTNAYRAYSTRYLQDARVAPFRDVFNTYELLAYLSVRATQLKYRACEIPVTRAYPKNEKTPTKISPFKGNWLLLKILFRNLVGAYNP